MKSLKFVACLALVLFVSTPISAENLLQLAPPAPLARAAPALVLARARLLGAAEGTRLADEALPTLKTDEKKPAPKPTPAPTLPPVDFDCKKKSDGFYADPKDKCSSKFYACVGGYARRMECGASSLVYEPETSRCELRDDSPRCTGVRKTTLPTTPQAPVPTPASLPIDCSKMDDGWYSEPGRKCSNVFYSCANGLGYRFQCAGNMYFDAESKSCLAHDEVEACTGKKRTTTPTPTTTKPPIKEKLPVDCTDKPSGHYADPSSKCSPVFFMCSNGEGFKQSCPDGLFYDTKRSLCDFFDEIFDCSGQTKPPTKPTTPPLPSPASLLSSEYDCKNKTDGSYTPEDKKCSQTYFRCVGGSAYKWNCPAGLYYDKENDVCDRYSNLLVCSGKKPKPTPAPTTPKPAEKLPLDCTKRADGDYEDPEKKCSSTYYSCSSSVGSRRQCPTGLYYDKEIRMCDEKGNVQDCSGKPRTTPKPTKKPAPVTKAPYNCDKRGDGNYESGKCNDHFWSCVGGTAFKSLCPPGTYYDTELNQCGYKEEIPACGGVRPST